MGCLLTDSGGRWVSSALICFPSISLVVEAVGIVDYPRVGGGARVIQALWESRDGGREGVPRLPHRGNFHSLGPLEMQGRRRVVGISGRGDGWVSRDFHIVTNPLRYRKPLTGPGKGGGKGAQLDEFPTRGPQAGGLLADEGTEDHQLGTGRYLDGDTLRSMDPIG